MYVKDLSKNIGEMTIDELFDVLPHGVCLTKGLAFGNFIVTYQDEMIENEMWEKTPKEALINAYRRYTK